MLARLAFRLWNSQDQHDLLIFSSMGYLKALLPGGGCTAASFSARKGWRILPHFIRGVLSSRDLDWLLTRVQSRWKDVSFAWADLYHRATIGNVDVDPTVRDKVLAAISASTGRRRRDRPGQAAAGRIRTGTAREATTDGQGEGARVTLAEAVDRSLALSNFDDAERMRRLSLLCFSREVFQFRDVDGQWGDLDASRQGKVLAACRTGLAQGEPTGFPDSNSFSTANYAEAKAFTTAIRDASVLDWLEPRLIRTWLPVVLRTRCSDAVETVTACTAQSRSETVATVIGEIEREIATSKGHMLFADIIPTELWPGAMSQRVAAFIDDETTPAPTRAVLLQLLAERNPEAALPVALRWSAGESDGNDGDVLRCEALNVRLARSGRRLAPN